MHFIIRQCIKKHAAIFKKFYICISFLKIFMRNNNREPGIFKTGLNRGLICVKSEIYLRISKRINNLLSTYYFILNFSFDSDAKRMLP